MVVVWRLVSLNVIPVVVKTVVTSSLSLSDALSRAAGYGLTGFEPATHGLGTRCLLYRAVCKCSGMSKISELCSAHVRLR